MEAFLVTPPDASLDIFPVPFLGIFSGVCLESSSALPFGGVGSNNPGTRKFGTELSESGAVRLMNLSVGAGMAAGSTTRIGGTGGSPGSAGWLAFDGDVGGVAAGEGGNALISKLSVF